MFTAELRGVTSSSTGRIMEVSMLRFGYFGSLLGPRKSNNKESLVTTFIQYAYENNR